MKKILLTLCVVLGVVSCSKPTETIKALQDAATGEANASAKYEFFAKVAARDSLYNVSALFMAASQAERVHLNTILTKLKELGVDYKPNVNDVVLDSVVSNLYVAKSGEEYEAQSMYPEMVDVAKNEQQMQVAQMFEDLIVVEDAHAQLYIAAIESLQTNGNDNDVEKVYMVCPTCGYIYTPSNVVDNCLVCKAATQKFKKFSGNV